VRLHGRALDILCALAAAKGGVVGKDELMARLWPGRIVQESNIHVYVSALRKALDEQGEGHSYVVTVPGRGYRLAGLAGARSPGSSEPAPAQSLRFPDKPSIAVMPFANLSGDPEQEYFADGMVEEIITALSRIRWLFVIARNSSFTYKGQAIDLGRVGRELGVRYVLEGSVRRSGGRVRITAQLIEAETSAHLWADRFDGSLEDIFELQDNVALSVAGVVEPALQASEIRRAARRPTNDLTAYDLCLRAQPLYWSLDKERIFEALSLLEEAIAREPEYGPALGWAAICCAHIQENGWSESPELNQRRGVDYARRALFSAGEDASTLANAGFLLAYHGEDINRTMEIVDRALVLNPSFARGWYLSGQMKVWAGDPDAAIERLEKSMRLSPRARVGSQPLTMGLAYLMKRHFELAARHLQTAIQEQPSSPQPYRPLAACYAHMGELEKARHTIDRLRSLTPVLIPNTIHWRNPENRELYLSGLRLAAGETDG